MKTLLPIDSPLYLKRLARELNILPDAFYYDGGTGSNVRCNRAIFSEGVLQVRPCGNRGFRVIPQDTQFHDAYGHTVCASRT